MYPFANSGDFSSFKWPSEIYKYLISTAVEVEVVEGFLGFHEDGNFFYLKVHKQDITNRELVALTRKFN